MSAVGEIGPDYDGIWGCLDPVGTGYLDDVYDDEPNPSFINVAVSEDFMLLDPDARVEDNIVSDTSDSGWGLPREAMAETSHLGPPYFFRDSETDFTPRTPSPPRCRSFVANCMGNDISHVTPEKATSDCVYLPDMTELQMQYQRTLRKLATSMRRSDETRCIIKRQRVSSSCGRFDESDFFASPREKAMEESRRKLYDMIRQGTTSGLRL